MDENLILTRKIHKCAHTKHLVNISMFMNQMEEREDIELNFSGENYASQILIFNEKSLNT